MAAPNRIRESAVPRPAALSPYESSWEHLHDELALLNLRLLERVQGHSSAQRFEHAGAFGGLAISAEEVETLLTRGAGPLHGPVRHEIRSGRIGAENAIDESSQRIRSRRDASSSENTWLSLPILSRLFGLDEFEEQCIILGLAAVIDRNYARVFGFIEDDLTQRAPTVGLALDLFCASHAAWLQARSSFSPQATLLHCGLIEVYERDELTPLTARSFRLSDRIADFLLGANSLDRELAPIAHLTDSSQLHSSLRASPEILNRVANVAAHYEAEPGIARDLVIYAYGRNGSGRRSIAHELGRCLALPVLSCDARDILSFSQRPDRTMWTLSREAMLQPAILCIENFDAFLAEAPGNSQIDHIARAITSFSRFAVLIGARPWEQRGVFRACRFIEIECAVPDAAARETVWRQLLPEVHGGVLSEKEVKSLAATFALTQGRIRDAMVAARDAAHWAGAESTADCMAELTRACRRQASANLGNLARKVDAKLGWCDIVLPESQKQQLREIVDRIRHRHRVSLEWGFNASRSLQHGVTALFAGVSGTGKTLAAGIIAAEMGLDLYKIDLSGVVSKYIGETEKNLDRIFEGARDCNAILFFDEADALFGKRSEVKDSHDRYANIEVAYLLQKIEEYDGAVILATNLKKNIDAAFVRRMQFIIDFPFPEERERELIWRGIFPPQSPLAAEIDFEYLARKLAVAGGNIKNIAVRAAYFTAEANGEIDMPAIIDAAKRELQQMGKLISATEFQRYSGRVAGIPLECPQ